VCSRRHLGLVVLLALSAHLIGSAAASAGTAPVLTLTYTAANVLEVDMAGGSPLTAGSPTGLLSPGAYQVVITDGASDGNDPVHMFQLSGPGVNLMTDLQGGDDKSELYDESLAPNATYAFQDDDEPNLGAVIFKTTSTPAPATAPVTTTQASVPAGTTTTQSQSSNGGIVGSDLASVPFRGTLNATVSPQGKLTLVADRKGVTTLKEGRYRIAVSDRSTKVGFVLEETRAAAHKLTGGSFLGKRATTLDLRPGQWFFYATFVGTKTYFVVIS
jgi:hypothetical protein